MAERVELPVVMPYFTTYHGHGGAGIAAKQNPQADNWYLNNIIQLCCGRRFLQGYTGFDLGLTKGSIWCIPFLEKYSYNTLFIEKWALDIIKDMLRSGFYVEFVGFDDYYIKGKSWYQEKHFNHDGLITGFDEEQKTFTIVAYDSQWVYRPFRTPQAAFEKAVNNRCEGTTFGYLNGVRARNEPVPLDLPQICGLLKEYLHSNLDLYPPDTDERAFGAVTYDYLSMYLERLKDGRIPQQRMDRRPFRLIWEHKRCMRDRIAAVEKELGQSDDLSTAYAPLVKEADTMRFIYAKYGQKPQADLLSLLQKKLMAMKEKEEMLLTRFLERMPAV